MQPLPPMLGTTVYYGKDTTPKTLETTCNGRAWHQQFWMRFNGEKSLRMRSDVITWSISGKVIGLEAKSLRNIIKMKEEMAGFFVIGSVVVLLPM